MLEERFHNPLFSNIRLTKNFDLKNLTLNNDSTD